MRQVDSPKTPSLLAAHMTAAEIYESVTNGGATDFAELVTVLNRNKPWCLIGGLAVNCYVEPVYTVDVDLVVVAANLEQIGRELEAAGFRLSSELNVQFTTDARYQDFLAGATERQVLGVAVPVASLQEIVRGKVWAWQDKERRSTKRKKDELGLMRIAEAHPKLRGLIPAEIVKQL
ncbi:MAG: hypothetical protein DME84_06605 [Verrucomicrobia bacterium]|nr:MAG: hypothetical protein DME84_06605 [Verrucomicrobiota bacterium]